MPEQKMKRPSGAIRSESLYTLQAIDDELGLGKHALRKARREGLRVKRIGRRSYILGSDLIAWFEASAKSV